MGDEPLILALDQGTTSSRAIAFGRDGRPVAVAQQPFEQQFPTPGHVTHEPEAIWSSQIAVVRDVVRQVGGAERIAAIGITNQRETTIVWDRATGEPIADAIVWQSRITAPACERLRLAGHERLFRERTGLPLDAYFGGPKVAHILDAVPGARARAERGELCFGTVDSFLLWRLTGGTASAGAVHATDVSNASRTLLFDIHRLAWDDELLELVGVPRALLPDVRPTSGVFGETAPELFGRPIPIAAVVGDQQAATFGQACFEPGQAKNTYGTGAFLLLNTGTEPRTSSQGLLTTVGWQLGTGGPGGTAHPTPATYALEGSVFSAGSAVQWLRDGLGIIDHAGDVEALAASVEDSGGVYLVPAFTGLGAPYWDPNARGTIVGLTRGSGRGHVARATLESICFQVADVLDAMAADAGTASVRALRVDGGAASNDLLLQLQSDVLGVPVERPVVAETTALGAAYLAGLAVGYWGGLDDIESNWAIDRRFEPSMSDDRRQSMLHGWHRAVERSRDWIEPADGGNENRG